MSGLERRHTAPLNHEKKPKLQNIDVCDIDIWVKLLPGSARAGFLSFIMSLSIMMVVRLAAPVITTADANVVMQAAAKR